MKNRIHPGEVLDLVAAANRTSGVPVVERGFAGFPVTDAATGEVYALDIKTSVKKVPLLASSAVGDTVFINDTTFALTRAAAGTAAVAGTRALGRVVAIPGDDPGPVAGQMWVLQLPQAA